MSFLRMHTSKLSARPATRGWRNGTSTSSTRKPAQVAMSSISVRSAGRKASSTLWLFRTMWGPSIAQTDLSLASTVQANMQLRCLWVVTEAGSMEWTLEEKSSRRRCSHVTTVESCWQAKWSCKLTSRWSTKAGGTSSAASATRLSLPSQICRSTRAPCTPECCLTDVTFVRRCSQGEVN